MAMTNQEIFDKVARHLLTQGDRSYGEIPGSGGETHGCLYRGPNGTKCAAGFLIADEHYSPELEGAAVPIEGTVHGDSRRNLIGEALKESGVDAGSWSLVRALQGVHDHTSPHEWKAGLREAGRNKNLSLAVLDEFPETATA